MRQARGSRRLASGKPAFLPTSLSGLVWWLRADKGITLNASAVSGWADQSGLGDSARNADQATGARQPAYNSANSSYNNMPTVDFTAASTHYLLNSGAWSASYSAPYTMAFVGNSSAAPAGAVSAASGDYNDLWVSTPANDKTRHVSGAAGGNVIYTSTTSTSASIAIAVVNGASSKIFVRSLTSSASIAGTPGGTLGSVAMNIGRRAISSPQYWNGSIAEVFAYSRALTDAEVGQLMTYASQRYGIALI